MECYPCPNAWSPRSFQRRRLSAPLGPFKTRAAAVRMPRMTASSSAPRPALMTRPPNWILRRVSSLRSRVDIRALRAARRKSSARVRRSARGVLADGVPAAFAKGRSRLTPVRQPGVLFVDRLLKFEQDAGEQVILGIKHTDALDQLADFSAAFVQQV